MVLNASLGEAGIWFSGFESVLQEVTMIAKKHNEAMFFILESFKI
jgi:hypothetical protein